MLPQVFECGQLLLVFGVDRGQVIGHEIGAFRRRSGSRGSQEALRSAPSWSWRDFEGCQRPVEDLDLINQTVLEPAVAEPLADRDLVVAAAGDGLGQVVAHDFALLRGGR